MAVKLNDKIAFGKHRGSTIEEIIEDDPAYLEWALDEVDGFELHEDAHEALNRALERDDPLELKFEPSVFPVRKSDLSNIKLL